jgi:hypothetical protein
MTPNSRRIGKNRAVAAPITAPLPKKIRLCFAFWHLISRFLEHSTSTIMVAFIINKHQVIKHHLIICPSSIYPSHLSLLALSTPTTTRLYSFAPQRL